jgi:hypothetical protein
MKTVFADRRFPHQVVGLLLTEKGFHDSFISIA